MSRKGLHVLYVWTRAVLYGCFAIGLLAVVLRQHKLPDISLRHLAEIERMILQNNLSNAAHHLRAATAIAPEDEQALYLQGLVLQQTGDVPRAIQTYEQVLKLNARHLYANYNLGLLLLERRDFEGAMRHNRMVLSIDPRNENALTNLGLALLRLGRYAEAAENFRMALRVKPGFAPAQQNLNFMIAERLLPGL